MVARINVTETDNGARYTLYEADGFHVTIASNETYFTIRDAYDEPCGTIFRPRYNERHWQAWAANGVALTKTAVGPRSAFRSFLMYQAKGE